MRPEASGGTDVITKSHSKILYKKAPPRWDGLFQSNHVRETRSDRGISVGNRTKTSREKKTEQKIKKMNCNSSKERRTRLNPSRSNHSRPDGCHDGGTGPATQITGPLRKSQKNVRKKRPGSRQNKKERSRIIGATGVNVVGGREAGIFGRQWKKKQGTSSIWGSVGKKGCTAVQKGRQTGKSRFGEGAFKKG